MKKYLLLATDIVAKILSESTWAYNVTDPLVIKENADCLLKIKVKTNYIICLISLLVNISLISFSKKSFISAS